MVWVDLTSWFIHFGATTRLCVRVCDNLDEGEFTENSKAVLDCVPALGEVLCVAEPVMPAPWNFLSC